MWWGWRQREIKRRVRIRELGSEMNHGQKRIRIRESGSEMSQGGFDDDSAYLSRYWWNLSCSVSVSSLETVSLQSYL